MKRVSPLTLVTIGILLCLAAFGQLYRDNRGASLETGGLPTQIAGLDLTDSVSGESAIAEFTSLHGKEFPVTDGSIGYYGDGRVTLWLAGTSKQSIAAEMVGSMQVRIAEGNSPFTPVKEIQDNNRIVYVLDGMGQKHYYFQSNNLVIWLASDSPVADEAIQQILDVYP
jgi:hypothetical protein